MQEILNFDVQLDEEVDLDQKRRNIKAIEKSKEKFEKIAKLISSEQIEHNLSDVIKLLETIRPNVGDEVNLSISALDRTLNEFTHAQEEVLKLLNGQNFDINELENIEERLFKLRALGRKYNVATDQLLALVQKMDKKIRNARSQQRVYKRVGLSRNQSYTIVSRDSRGGFSPAGEVSGCSRYFSHGRVKIPKNGRLCI
jgi:DNA repair protein RecN (Recombination protein N)